VVSVSAALVVLASACARPPGNVPHAAPQALRPDARATATEDLPPVDRPWTGAEYARALAIVRSKAAEGPGALARFTAASPAFFSRMVHPENLAPARNRSISQDDRLSALEPIQVAMKQIAPLYGAAWDAGQPLDREVLALVAFHVHLMAVLWDMIDEVLLTIEPSDPNYVARMDSIAEMSPATEEVTTAALTLAKKAIGQSAPFWNDVSTDWATLVHRVSRNAESGILREMDALDRRTIDASVRQAIERARQAISSLPAPAFVVTATDIRDGSGRILCPLPSRRADGIAATYKLRGPGDLHVVPLANAVPPSLHGRRVQVAIDPTTPYRILVEVLFTLGQNGIALVELRSTGDDAWRLDLNWQKDEPPSDTLHFATLISNDGFSLKAKGMNVAPGCNGFASGLAIPNRDRTRDLEALAACAANLKRSEPKSRRVVLVANPEVPFSEVFAVARALQGSRFELFPQIQFGVTR
jgi:biopolymer transport protein ExbD